MVKVKCKSCGHEWTRVYVPRSRDYGGCPCLPLCRVRGRGRAYSWAEWQKVQGEEPKP